MGDFQSGITTGTIVSVEPAPEAANLLGDHPAGATTLVVSSEGMFYAAGRCRVGHPDTGTDHDYIRTDGTLTIAPGLAAAAEAGTPVTSLSPTGLPEAQRFARVDLDGFGEKPVRALIPTGEQNYYPIGFALTGALVDVVSDGKYGYKTAGRPLEQPQMDARALDPTTIPDQVAVEPPEESPALTVHGMPNSLMLRADPVASTTLIEYHVSTVDGFTADTTTQVGNPTRSLVMVVTNLPNGEQLLPDTPYYVRAVATNSAGTAPPGEQNSGQLDLEAVSSVLAAEVVAGFVLTGRIDIGAAYIDADEGIVVPGVMTIPVDGVSLPTILMHLLARSATFEDNVNLYGTSQLYGLLRLANGIIRPSQPPSASRTWPHLSTDLADSGFADRYFGLTDNPTGDRWITALSLFGGAIIELDKTTGDQIWSHGLTSDYNPFGGITRLGTAYYTLGADAARDNRWFVYRYDATFTKTGEWEFAYEPSSPYLPAIGNDGTDLVVASTSSKGETRVRTFTPATGALVSTTTLAVDVVDHLSSVMVGSADFGATRVVVASQTKINVYTAAGNTSAHAWGRAGNSKVQGLHWDGTRFWHLDDAGRIWEYSTQVTAQAIDSAYAWYDGDPADGPHETEESPRATYTRPARAWLVIETPPAPEAGVTDPTQPNKANQVRIYAGPAGGVLRLQDTPPIGDWSTVVDTLDTGSKTPEPTNGFDTANKAPGLVQSTVDDALGPIIDLQGSGAGRAGPHRWNEAGESLTERRGVAAVTTDAGSEFSITHGLGSVPTYVNAIRDGAQPVQLTILAVTDTTATFRVRDYLGQLIPATSLTFRWKAEA